jgi:hypothetical protein
VYIHPCIHAIAASIVKIIEVNKPRIPANSTDTEDATSVAENKSSRSKCPAVKLLETRNVVFKDLKNFPNISIAGKNKLKIKGIFQVTILQSVVYINIGDKPIA